MNLFRKYYQVLRLLGPRTAAARVGIAMRNALGLTRRAFRPIPWNRIDLARITTPGTPSDASEYAAWKNEAPPRFLFPLGEPPAIPNKILNATPGRSNPLHERLSWLQDDRCIYFGDQVSPEPIDWHRNAMENKASDPVKVWCDLRTFDPGQGDPRTLWEPSRAAWAYDIARARAQQSDVGTDDLLYRWLDSWMNANPPFSGFQWKCGQESAVRLIALSMAFWACAKDKATTPARWTQFARLAWATGYRIQRHIQYAVSQKNNHALSEACGLMLISQLFPELRAAEKWHHTGRRIIETELRRQIYNDGSYVQHSMNYHRVMLHASILALRLGELSEEPFPDEFYERIGDAGSFLFQMMDAETGRVPDYGHNDGALVLPVSECAYYDYRPAVQESYFLAHGKRRLPLGPWDESLIWLFGENAAASEIEEPRQPESIGFPDGGYYTLRRPNSWAMVRCHTYHHRPSHCDPLQVDLWWQGQNVVRDCGTFRYYDAERPDREHYFKSIAAHNTVQIDGESPMELVSRFLWLPWLRGTTRHFQPRGVAAIFIECQHESYDRLPVSVLHRRTVVSLTRDVWFVVDDLMGSGAHSATLRWHLMDAPFEMKSDEHAVTLSTPRGPFTIGAVCRPVSADRVEVIWGRDTRNKVQGFAAPFYGRCEAIPTLELEVSFMNTERLLTVMAPGNNALANFMEQTDEFQRWEIQGGDERWIVDLDRPSRQSEKVLLDPHDLELGPAPTHTLDTATSK